MNSAEPTRRPIRKKADQHKWTPREDVALVEALTELCVGGYWKVDNGFRTGYLGQLEHIIKQKLPGSEIKADPHIESRLKTLKKQTLAIHDMLTNSSGFSWNHEEKMVLCEKQVFDGWVKVHKDAAGLRFKPFIHYDSLIEAFGRDRANGLGAEGPAEANEYLNGNDFVDIAENDTDEMTTPSPPVAPSSVGRTPANPPSARTRKRARDAYSQCLGDMASTLRSFVDMTKAHLETVQGVLMNEHLTSERRGKIVDELMKIEGITDQDVIDAAAIIIGDDSKIDLLFSLPNHFKRRWLHRILGH